MNRLRTILVCAMLALAALGSAGCGAGTVGSIGLYSLSHTRFARHYQTLMSTVRCGWHGYRLVHDLHRRHLGWAALQGYWAARSCSRAVSR